MGTRELAYRKRNTMFDYSRPSIRLLGSDPAPSAREMLRRYRGTSFIRNTPLLGQYSRTIPRVLRWSYGGWLFLISEVPLYSQALSPAAPPRRSRTGLLPLNSPGLVTFFNFYMRKPSRKGTCSQESVASFVRVTFLNSP